MIRAPLVAWLAYLVDQIASVGARKRGKLAHELVRGDLADHVHVYWNKGIQRALKFMMDKKKCPTRNPIIGAVQKRRKKK